MNPLRNRIVWLAIFASVFLSGCSSQSNPLERILALHKKGDKDAAIALFLETPWKSDTIFAKGSVLAMTEDEFSKLKQDEMSKATSELLPLMNQIRGVVKSVLDHGLEVGRTDKSTGKKYFDRANEFGSAIENSTSTKLVQMVGKGLKVMIATESAKVGK